MLLVFVADIYLNEAALFLHALVIRLCFRVWWRKNTSWTLAIFKNAEIGHNVLSVSDKIQNSLAEYFPQKHLA